MRLIVGRGLALSRGQSASMLLTTICSNCSNLLALLLLLLVVRSLPGGGGCGGCGCCSRGRGCGHVGQSLSDEVVRQACDEKLK